MPLSIKELGGIYDVEWTDGLRIHIERMHEDSKGVLTGEVTITHSAEINPHIHQARLNFTSTRSRNDVARHCAKRVVGGLDEAAWSDRIESMSVNVLKLYRTGEPVLNLREVVQPESLSYRVNPYAFEGQANLIYGAGGLGKSMFGANMAVIVGGGVIDSGMEAEPGRVLYLDWETDAFELHNRVRLISEGACLVNVPDIYYRFCSAPLASDIHWIRRIVLDHNIQFVIVDSAGPACGGNPEAADATLQFFAALRSLRVTSLIIAHVSKNGNSEKGPFGSVYWMNMSRNVWELKKSQDSDSEALDIALIHRKVNNGKLLKPRGYRVNFSHESIAFESIDPKVSAGLSEHMPMADRIGEVLKRGAMSYQQIADALGANEGTTRKTLSQQNGKRFQNIGGGLWGNLERTKH